MPDIRPAAFQDEGHIYTDSKTGLVIPSVTQVLESVGLCNYNGVRQAVLDHKADIGTEVHHACALLDKGENLADYEIDERVLPYIESYATFKDKAGWKPILVEYGPLAASLNEMAVGFKLDRVGILGGIGEYIAELKTTAAVPRYVGLQLAGYDLCLGEMKRQRIVIHLQPDGRMAKLTEFKDMTDYQVFVQSLAIVHWKRNHKISEE